MEAGLTHVGKYRLIKLLATGGMGEVYLAKQEGPAGFSKPVVVKRILPHLARDPAFVQMFLDEARLAAVLNHPNVVQIFELGEDQDGSWFIAMEYLHGRSLRALKQAANEQKVPLSPPLVARVVAQALHGLHYAHTLTNERGEKVSIVHRDMSPDNVMVGFNGVAKVLDFGIAKASNAITTTRSGTVKGKFAYMAPEQLLAEPLDGRTDVYAVGILLYELLCGHRPFTAPTEAALVNLILNAPVPPLKQQAPHLNDGLCNVVMKALAKEAKDRFKSAEELAQLLEKYVAHTGEPVTPAATAQAMRALFGDSVADTQVSLTPSKPSQVPLPAAQRASNPQLLAPGAVTQSRGALPGPVEAGRAGPGRNVQRPKWWVPAVVAGAVLLMAVSAVLGRAFKPAELPDGATKSPVAAEAEKPSPVAVDAPKAPPAVEAGKPSPVAVDAPKALPVVEAGKPAPVAVDAPKPPPAVEAPLRPLPIAPATPAPNDPILAALNRKPVVDAGVAAPAPAPAPAASGKGLLAVRINPWAEIFENGKSLGVTPCPPLELPAGTHVLTVKNPELSVEKTVTVKILRGGTTPLRLDLLE